MEDVKSLSHSKYRCKYHIVFASKYRRQIIYKKIKTDAGKILRELCERKGVTIIEGIYTLDHFLFLTNQLIRSPEERNDRTKSGQKLKSPVSGRDSFPS